MKKRIFIALACALALTAMAQKPPAKKLPDLDVKDCQYLTVYQPNVDGSADYKPGVDAHGKPVVEADVAGPQITLPDKYSFNVTVDVAEYMGVAVPSGLEEKAVIGEVTVDKDGHVTFNGKPLESDAEASLRALCKGYKPGITVK